MEALGIEDARKDLGGIVDRARFKGETTPLTRAGKLAAAVVPADLCEHVQAAIEEDGDQSSATEGERP